MPTNKPVPDSRDWWEQVAQGLGVSAWSAAQEVEAVKQQLPNGAWRTGASLARCVEDLRMERDLYRGTLVGLLPVCDAAPSELATRITRLINRALRTP